MEQILVAKIDFGGLGTLYLNKKNYDDYTLGCIEEEMLRFPCILDKKGLIPKDYADEIDCTITFMNMEKKKYENLPEFQGLS